ncbi:MAG TPA: YggS family pyridoxal phosphate-dependent enzyme [Pirellulales bacterium]|jgi:hypothetical protein
MVPDSQLADNLAAVRAKITEAALRSGRSPGEVTLVAVTKYVSAAVAQQLGPLGCHDLGESRPQQLWAKAESLHAANQSGSIHWHLIGHLQRNKVDRTLPLVSLIHSGDSLRLIQAVDEAALALNRCIPTLIEVNVSGDPAKHGFKPAEVEPAFASMAALSSLEIRGLMCMASREGDLDQARREFASLRELRDQLRQVAPPNINLRELSMGMSGDFEVAIEEGATIVRIGSALFEEIDG